MVTRNTHWRLALGMTLTCAIPVAAVWCALDAAHAGSPRSHVIIAVVLGAGSLAAGLALMRTCPVNTSRLKHYLGRMANGDVPDESLNLIKTEADIAAIETYTNSIVPLLRRNLEAVERRRIELEEKLFHARKLESLDLITCAMAHDLNNYLSAIMGNAGMISGSAPPDSLLAERALRIRAAAEPLAKLANELMMCTGRCALPEEELDLSSVVGSDPEDLAQLVPNNASIKCELGRNVPRFKGHNASIRDMVARLVQNAGDAVMDTEGVIGLRTGTTLCGRDSLDKCYLGEKAAPGEYAFVEVSDNGCGMSPRVMEKMFDPFFSTKIRGCGLGLSLVLGIARAHRAVIRVKSEPGGGTAFRVLFPCAKADKTQ